MWGSYLLSIAKLYSLCPSITNLLSCDKSIYCALLDADDVSPPHAAAAAA